MNTQRFHIYLLTWLVGACSMVLAQQTDYLWEAEYRYGLVNGFGAQSVLDVRYDYRVHLFQGQVYSTLYDEGNWGIELLVQPQFNFTTFKQIDSVYAEKTGYEFGLNAGILLRKFLLDDFLSVYAGFSFGPHYASGVQGRQSRGFIFSDNFFIGLHIQLRENLYLDFRPGFRHISNAALQSPNLGVNNLIIGGGVLYVPH